MNLRNVILASLSSLPGTRQFHLHLLVSSPRKYAQLYPFAHPHPKTFIQDILILLSEQPPPNANGESSPRVFVSAIEASVYQLPSTSCGILYVSKVDSTGLALRPSPTPTLVRALLKFYASPSTCPIAVDNLWIHLFARAQNQYLFPNSVECGKKPLNDVKLCAWWKRLIGDVAGEVSTNGNMKLFYVLPGLNEGEAEQVVGKGDRWTYGHPYSQSEVAMPCGDGEKGWNLGRYIPSFDDDPKSRFMDEIAYTTEGVRSPERKRPRLSDERRQDEPKKEKDKEKDKVQGELKKVSADEFWERMSFRQECVAGAITGFFVMAVSGLGRGGKEGTQGSQAGQVSSQVNKRVLASLMTGHEFSSAERAARSTEKVEETIRGLCEGLKATPEAAETITVDETPRTPPKRTKVLVEVSSNPFPEPLETYRSHVYGTVDVCNAAVETTCESAPVVRVLTARKRRK